MAAGIRRFTYVREKVLDYPGTEVEQLSSFL